MRHQLLHRSRSLRLGYIGVESSIAVFRRRDEAFRILRFGSAVEAEQALSHVQLICRQVDGM
ncbi:hypothetical protein AAW14_20490 [Streptomyces hygroscopicus]|nr:hypothetical protein [Streptomyces hygroscopicus]